MATGATHNKVLNRIHHKLMNFFEDTKCSIYSENVALAFENEYGVMNQKLPDLFIICDENFDNDKYSRSYYPKAPIPLQEQLSFDNVHILHDKPIPFLLIATPVDLVTISNSSIRNNPIKFVSNKAMSDYLKTSINIYGCSFDMNGVFELLQNDVVGKKIYLKTSNNIELKEGFSAKVQVGKGDIHIDSDLHGLQVKK